MRPGTAKEVFGVTIDEDALERETAKILDDGADREKMRAALAEVQVLLKSFDLPEGMTTSSTAGERLAYVVVSVAKGDVVARSSEQRGAENG